MVEISDLLANAITIAAVSYGILMTLICLAKVVKNEYVYWEEVAIAFACGVMSGVLYYFLNR